ncbi:chorismate synthase [Allomyces macrogynus ATCC 38327]|uniref:Chorismate synthase n=1 Tax=Allomyces macrogynus (strain ATCC 38327) TaxID=578462 RepID=A0A0L0S5D6_ALLM3|nr:chorismate synthase [Allomyces macrogynus ATCC 38327]|eukprot:KNE57670.1 chorismate synthase [Allomyces macrogynus ATCC 38327]
MSHFGTLFRVSTFGESHCKGVGCIVEGVPPGLPLTEDDVQPQLTRRRPGQSALTTPRDEKDRVTILSGTEMGVTLGTPIGLFVPNQDQRPGDYSETDLYPRPSHADYTYLQKYGVKASSGGGRSSARETIGRVAAGAIAEKYLSLAHNVEIVAFTSSIGPVSIRPDLDTGDLHAHDQYMHLLSTVTRSDVDATDVRCPVPTHVEPMRQVILDSRAKHDSIGGTVTCVIRNPPIGLGEPCFDKLEASLAHAMLSIPATKGFEIGSGFAGTRMPGSVHNDAWVPKANGKLGTRTNYSGGIQGGISNGEAIYFTVAFKPAATIGQEQVTTRYDGVEGKLAARGRHDPSVVPRAVPIVEAMAALVIMDALLVQNSRRAAIDAIPQAIRDKIHEKLTGKVSADQVAATAAAVVAPAAASVESVPATSNGKPATTK